MRKIAIINESRKYKINAPFIKRVALRVLRHIKAPADTELEFVFLDDKGIRALNKRYRQSDHPTDVLSFRLERGEYGCESFLGEIVISLERAAEQALDYGALLGEEVVLYVIHGILHLFGHEDYTPGAKARMSKLEKGILNKICAKEALSKVLTRR